MTVSRRELFRLGIGTGAIAVLDACEIIAPQPQTQPPTEFEKARTQVAEKAVGDNVPGTQVPAVSGGAERTATTTATRDIPATTVAIQATTRAVETGIPKTITAIISEGESNYLKGTATAVANQPPRVVTATPVPATLTAVPQEVRTPTPVMVMEAKVTAAEKRGTQWVLRHPDGDKTELRTLPEGFIPDASLYVATDIKPLEVGDLIDYKDWETALNTKRARGALAGYNYDYNDFCQVPNPPFTCNVQADMYAWRILQGEEIRVPGVGILKGGERRSVVLIVLNLDGSVHAWDPEKNGPVYDKHGFTATGRIFDGEHNVDVLERNLSGHWLYRQANGTPEKSYVGIANSPDNARETLIVTVQRKQWGNEVDEQNKERVDAKGNKIKRMEFQLVRAEVVKFK